MVEINSTSAIAMLEVGLLSFIIPIGMLVVWKIKNKKTENVSVVPFFAGIFSYILFGFIIKSLVNAICVGFKTPFSVLVGSNIFVSSIYFAFVGAIFDQLGKLFVFKNVFIKSIKKYTGPKDVITFGIGFGAVEAVLSLGIVYIQNYVYASLVNNGTMDQILQDYAKSGDSTAIDNINYKLQEIATITPIDCMLYAVDRVAMIFIQIALCILVYSSIVNYRKMDFHFACIIHFLTLNIFYFSTKAGSIANNLITEFCAVVVTAVIVYLAFITYKSFDKNIKFDDSGNSIPEASEKEVKTEKEEKSISKVAKGKYN
ncbi:MAG: YhfC family intramembrane metalloprotease [Lachnospiraceae bacterium]|nr:YhfC family intramembrane metalloprotease [Lachnospiraceae bacterium]